MSGTGIRKRPEAPVPGSLPRYFVRNDSRFMPVTDLRIEVVIYS